jgi:hypothetical protein
MIRQFKLILICTLLFLPQGIIGQDSVFNGLDSSIDSLHTFITLEVDQKIRAIKSSFKEQINHQNLLIDSLQSEISIQKEEQGKLISEKEMMVKKLAELNQSVQSHKQIIKEEHKRFKRILLISGPSILVLIIFCAVLFFVLIIKYRDQTEKKISALKKYTHSEIEDTRNDLLNKMKKRLKKLRESGSKQKKGKEKGKNKKIKVVS